MRGALHIVDRRRRPLFIQPSSTTSTTMNWCSLTTIYHTPLLTPTTASSTTTTTLTTTLTDQSIARAFESRQQRLIALLRSM